MAANRQIASEHRTIEPGQVIALTPAFTPPANPMTMSATVVVTKGGPMYFDAIEGGAPSNNSEPAEVGDQLDVIGSEDLRLVRLTATSATRLRIRYFGGGDQV